jgi:5'-methylthioadenosine phosphorylase
MATDYDTWHPAHDSVTVEAVVRILNQNVDLAKRVVAALIPMIADSRECNCGNALQSAIMTAPEFVPRGVKEKLGPLLGKYVANTGN